MPADNALGSIAVVRGVRILPLAVAVSAVIHAAVVAWWTTRPPTPRRSDEARPATPIEIVTVEPAPPTAPLDVQLFELPASEPHAPSPALREPPRRSRDVAAPRPTDAAASAPPSPAAPRAGASAGDPPPARAGEPGRRGGLLAMRHGEAPSAALPAGRWDDLDHAPRGTAPERRIVTGLLHESGGGDHASDQDVFNAVVHPDGTVELHDAPNLQIGVGLPSLKDLGHALADWYESDKGPYGAEGNTAMARQIQLSAGATATAQDPTEPRPKDRSRTVILPILTGRFDLTDWLMRNNRLDPYDRRKLVFLDATRDERVQIGTRGRAEHLAQTPQIVQKSLEALWAATTDLAARKQALFELWDDCVETGDPAVVDAAAAARRMIIGFIRARLPADSASAYTAAEIAALTQRKRSTAGFAPYE
jgi:hypothetical protein